MRDASVREAMESGTTEEMRMCAESAEVLPVLMAVEFKGGTKSGSSSFRCN
jgi:hypothetical protein